MERIPERDHVGRKPAVSHSLTWHLGATDFTALVIQHCWPEGKIVFKARLDLPEQDEARLMYNFLITRFAAQGKRAAMAAQFKLDGSLPPVPRDWLVHKSLPLSDYQVAASYFCMGHDAAALFMDRGTGKTATAIHTLCMEARRVAIQEGRMQRVLVIVPNQVRSNWVREIRRFAVTRGKQVILEGGKLERIKRLTQACVPEPDCEWSVVIVGYDTLANSVDVMDKVPWDFVWSDESQKFKADYTGRWKAMLRIREASARRRILTGSPIGNSPMDLWTQLEFLGEGLSGFTTFKAFRKFYGEWITVDTPTGGVEKLTGLKNTCLLQERLARLAFQITKAEAGLKLPDKVYVQREMTMTKSQADYYKKTAEELAVEIEDKATGKVMDAMSAEHHLTRLLRLAQITSGFVTWDAIVDPDSGEVVRPRKVQQINAENPKVEAVVSDLMEELDEDPLGKKIVFAIERESLVLLHKRLSEELDKRGWQCGLYYGGTPQKHRDTIERAFNCDPQMKILVGNPQCMGEGLDLIGYDKEQPDSSETYVDHEVFFSQNWSSLLRGQSEDRGHRRGTRVSVRISDYVVLGTIDEEIRDVVSNKQEMASRTLAVGRILESILGLKVA
tara:strand:- start:16746 stop:18593 length:1848 start_codon:yes stop_codon:yes gene_type:complete